MKTLLFSLTHTRVYQISSMERHFLTGHVRINRGAHCELFLSQSGGEVRVYVNGSCSEMDIWRVVQRLLQQQAEERFRRGSGLSMRDFRENDLNELADLVA